MNENDKSVIITHEFFPFRGGVATYCLELAAAAAGEVEVWASGSNPGEGEFDYIVQWLEAGTRLHPLDLIRFARRLRSKKNELRESKIVLASVGAMMGWMLAGRMKVKKLTLVFHGSEILKFARWPWRGMSRTLVKGADRVVCVSKAVAGLMRKSHLGTSVESIILASGAPGREMRRLAESIQSETRSEHEVRILTLARIHPRKGQLEMARALKLLPEAVKMRVTFWIAGKGDTEYWQQVREALDESGVRWKAFGEVTDEQAAELYAECDFYVMSSVSQRGSVEGLGITYLEAALFGKPSVAFDSGGVGEAVLDEFSGLLAPEGDVAGLAARIERLVCDTDLRKQLGEGARAHGAKFNWETAARRILS